MTNNTSNADAKPWQLVAVGALGFLLGACLMGVAWFGSVTLEHGGDESFRMVCEAVGGSVYGNSLDVCADTNGQILLLDTGAQ
jgi:hypothetical protein